MATDGRDALACLVHLSHLSPKSYSERCLPFTPAQVTGDPVPVAEPAGLEDEEPPGPQPEH